MGAVQRLATVVIVGLVALSTILVLYLADEGNRIEAEEEEQKEVAIERATENYLSLCMSCHGPAGEGYAAGDGRVGMPLNTSENQRGVNAQGTPVSGGLDRRAAIIRETLHEGRGLMPAWGEESGGPLNDEQIEELVVMIQHVDWNHVYNEAVEAAGGYPTAEPTEAPESDEGDEPEQPAEPNTYNVAMGDNYFEPAELVVPANTDITINLTNEGVSTHNFNIDELGVQSGDVESGGSVSFTFNTGAPAEYEFYCSIPGHREAGMVGRLVVTDDPAQLPAAEGDGQPAQGDGPAGDAPGSADEPAEGDGDASAGAETTFDVEMVDIAFTQTELTVPANTEITINLVNNGAALHNFNIDELGVSSGDYAPGETGTVTFNSGEPGTYEYYCSIPGHREAGMVGTLIVQ